MQRTAARGPGAVILGIVTGLASVPFLLSLLDRPAVLACLGLAVLVAAVALPGWARTGLLAGVASAVLGTMAALVLAAAALWLLVEGVAAILG